MSRVLVLFAHPALEKSRVHRRLLEAIPDREELTFHDLYEAYPRLDVDVRREQALLVEHDTIVFQFPFYWYSTPSLLKLWQDLVLEHGWAYGSGGTALRGKRFMCAVTAGGSVQAYCEQGYNYFTVRELMAPLEQTAKLCRMRFLPPWMVYGTHALEEEQIAQAARQYRIVLEGLIEDRAISDAVALARMQDFNRVAREWAAAAPEGRT